MKKNRVGYFILVLLMAALTAFFPSSITCISLYTMLILPLVTGTMAYISYKRIRTEQMVDAISLYKGETLRVTLRLYNPDFFYYPFIRLRLDDPRLRIEGQEGPITCSVVPRRRETFELSVQCCNRGYYKVGIQSLLIQDFLGLFYFHKKIEHDNRVTVYPRFKGIDNLVLHGGIHDGSSNDGRTLGDDFSEILYIDHYQPQDSIRNIHWKLTSKKSELLVKRHPESTSLSSVLLVDLQEKQGRRVHRVDQEDAILETALSIADFCIHHSSPLQVAFCHREEARIACNNQADFDELYNLFACVDFVGKMELHELAMSYYSQGFQSASFFMVTDTVTPALCDTLAAMTHENHTITLVYVYEGSEAQKEDDFARLFAPLYSAGVECYTVCATEKEASKSH